MFENLDHPHSVAVVGAGPAHIAPRWREKGAYAAECVGSLMSVPVAVFDLDMPVSKAIEHVRSIPLSTIFTYGYVVDGNDKLLGVLVMRALFIADPENRVADVMLDDVFFLTPEMTFLEAMNETVARHYPEYPVCDDANRLIGVVRGQALFDAEVISITAQPGVMVGVAAEEALATPFWRSMKLRLPWLQVNLVTAFLAAGVVGLFQDVVDRIVLLAVFLPVLAGQASNTGAQSLAVALRSVILGKLNESHARALLCKEAGLGVLGGAIGGLSAGLGMLCIALIQGNPAAVKLAIVVFFAMTFSAIVSGLVGGILPIVLTRLRADPAVASSIILTTITDVVSMGSLLALATVLI